MRHYNRLALKLMLVVCLAVVAGCENGDQEQSDGDVSVTRAIGDFKLQLPEPPEPDPSRRCTEPKPDDIGCSLVCKPCVTFVCVDGEWVRQEIDFPEGICDPASTPEPVACPLTEIKTETGATHRFCAAECDICF